MLTALSCHLAPRQVLGSAQCCAAAWASSRAHSAYRATMCSRQTSSLRTARSVPWVMRKAHATRSNSRVRTTRSSGQCAVAAVSLVLWCGSLRLFKVTGAHHLRAHDAHGTAANAPPSSRSPSTRRQRLRSSSVLRLLPARSQRTERDLVLGVAPPKADAPPGLMFCTMPCALVGPGLDSQFIQRDQEALFFTAGYHTKGDGPAYWPIPFEPLTAPTPPLADAAGVAVQADDVPLQSSGAVLSYVPDLSMSSRRAAGRSTRPRMPVTTRLNRAATGGGAGRRPSDGVENLHRRAPLGVFGVVYGAVGAGVQRPRGGGGARRE